MLLLRLLVTLLVSLLVKVLLQTLPYAGKQHISSPLLGTVQCLVCCCC
jgi:hypothetical protein